MIRCPRRAEGFELVEIDQMLGRVSPMPPCSRDAARRAPAGPACDSSMYQGFACSQCSRLAGWRSSRG